MSDTLCWGAAIATLPPNRSPIAEILIPASGFVLIILTNNPILAVAVLIYFGAVIALLVIHDASIDRRAGS